MLLNSPSIIHDSEIPPQYTCDGENINPPFTISYVPQNAQSLVFLVEDPDAPAGLWVHWMIWNMDPKMTEIREGEVPKGAVGMNSGMTNDWYPICPPEGEHRYHFKLFALDTMLELDEKTVTREDLLAAMEDHIVAKAELVGRYTKAENKVTLEQPTT
ncbi:MAG: Phospholipid-binding protein, PBP family [candidate division WS6 bacterium GW2011_GWF2_39_15]|uniref:Phospholipid-binding protein, PBP family n=1 Tax=candidate division WS6 bacterium GW2011_GWF2_39_15 TaxID=1619100 RepID=A0A0G0Q768_9BACT|nr:MAG: Phospholipid-binding protein, PBP family [candidate division WS6 bacterium GW2011_GWF2_39_15]